MKTTIQTIRKHASDAKAIDEGKNGETPVFYYFGEQLPERFAHEVIRLDHTGWFTNEDGETYKDGSGLARGIVASLPASPGFPDGRFLAGYHWGDNGERVLWPELYADEDEAARAADSHAETFAEVCREDNARWNEARRLEDEAEEKLNRLRECLALRHRACMSYVRDEARELIERVRDIRETLAGRLAQYC